MTQTPDEPVSDEPLPADQLDSVEDQHDEVDREEVDPDLDAARDISEEGDSLTTDDLLPEEEMTEYEPPEEPSTPTAVGETELDEEVGETIDERLAQEEPEEEA